MPESIPKKEHLISVVEDIIEEVSYLNREKADSSDVKLLILEMKEEFKRSEERFASMEKRSDERFATSDIRSNERFAASDKRIGDLIHSMDKRFNLLQWMIGLGLAFLSFLITLFNYWKPPITPEILEKAVYFGVERALQKNKSL
ncbi:MAG: hypothetical protein L6Q54_14030 [Leptospiraceae bacterium]|nr:hypothetical protein [Leptospiraceae bacterium]MCK6382354.1 hypothetical protein [Leptospiraceae bacterium]NUM41444.1 hypothetical protein [Leptospiraceae bacterium]